MLFVWILDWKLVRQRPCCLTLGQWSLIGFPCASVGDCERWCVKKCLHTWTPETMRSTQWDEKLPSHNYCQLGAVSVSSRSLQSSFNPQSSQKWLRWPCGSYLLHTHDVFIRTKAQIKLNYWIIQNGFGVRAIDHMQQFSNLLVFLFRSSLCRILSSNL